jgi:hypothetical protein
MRLSNAMPWLGPRVVLSCTMTDPLLLNLCKMLLHNLTT